MWRLECIHMSKVALGSARGYLGADAACRLGKRVSSRKLCAVRILKMASIYVYRVLVLVYSSTSSCMTAWLECMVMRTVWNKEE